MLTCHEVLDQGLVILIEVNMLALDCTVLIGAVIDGVIDFKLFTDLAGDG